MVVVAFPAASPKREMRAVKESAERVNGKEVYLYPRTHGSGYWYWRDIMQPKGNMIVDIGGEPPKLSRLPLAVLFVINP